MKTRRPDIVFTVGGSDIVFTVGGCVYRNMVHIGHSTSVAMLAAHSVASDGVALSGFSYMHATYLARDRCRWLSEQIWNPATPSHAISVDSDTAFAAVELLTRLPHVTGDVAIGIVPMYIGRSPLINCNRRASAADGFPPEGCETPGERRYEHTTLRLALHAGHGSADITSGGFGLAVFNLAWFRKVWTNPRPEVWEVDNPCGDNGICGVVDTGEDIAFCQSVRKRGGRVVALQVETSHQMLTAAMGDAPALTWT